MKKKYEGLRAVQVAFGDAAILTQSICSITSLQYYFDIFESTTCSSDGEYDPDTYSYNWNEAYHD